MAVVQFVIVYMNYLRIRSVLFVRANVYFASAQIVRENKLKERYEKVHT